MTSRTWGPDGSGIPISTTNLNGIEADLDRALGNKHTTVTSNYSMAAGDSVVIGNGSSITITLPDPTTVANNNSYVVKNINSSVLTVNSAGTSKTIDGAASVQLVQYGFMRVVSDGAVWRTIAGSYMSGASVRASGSNYGTSGTPSVTIPASAVAGDLLVVFIGANYAINTGSSPTPVGWTLLGYTIGSYHNSAVWAKVCTSSDLGATFSTVITNAGESWNAWAVAVQGVTGFGSGSVAQASNSGSAVTSVRTGPVLTTPNHLAVVFGSARVTAGGTPSSSIGTLVASRTSDTTNCSGIWLATNLGSLPSASITCSAATTGISSAIVSLY